MKTDIISTITKTHLPAPATYGTFDIIGNTVGKYFDYKRQTALIEHETIKVQVQGTVACATIDAKLKESLDNNQKNFDLEMKRLEIFESILDVNMSGQSISVLTENFAAGKISYIEYITGLTHMEKSADRCRTQILDVIGNVMYTANPLQIEGA